MRKIYSLLIYFIIPLVPFYLKKRGKKNPQYLLFWNERFSWRLHNNCQKPIIWLHAVSVGETRAMHKLVELIYNNYPQYQILITNMTPTGRETAKNMYPYALVHYIPYDLNICVTRFYQIFKPKLGIIMETEIWPNLIYFGNKNKVPLYLVNARLSNRSFIGYNRFKFVIMPIVNYLNGILCQDQNSANNFAKLNYSGNLSVVGNTKFDLVIPNNLSNKINQLKQLFGDRKIIIFASTRDGEEELILNNITLDKNIIYLFVPRHPERFELVGNLLKDRNILFQNRSENKLIEADTQVVIGDSMGDMLAYYAISYFAIIGGSINDFGGQNPIEAIFMNIPVAFGPSMFNFSDVAANALDFKCAIKFNNITELDLLINKIVMDENYYNQLNSNCKIFIAKYQGASQSIFEIIKKEL